MIKKTHVKVGDEVVVIAGRSKGQSGKVKEIIRKKDRLLVEDINLCKKSVKATEENPEGGFVEIEASIHISNVMLKEKYDQKLQKRKGENAK